jgi:putative DNA methylase
MPFPKGAFFPKQESKDGWYSRGYLPHVDREGMTQLVCNRLWDSMPKEVLETWERELAQMSEAEYDVARRKRIDAYLDQGWGSCLLRDPRVSEIVQNNWLHFAGTRYLLHAWVVMPNHTHILFTPLPGWKLDQIIHSWKSYTSHKINELLVRTGKIWQDEPFDRYIRDARHFDNALAYVENNPVKAGLCKKSEDWLWSSAHWRAQNMPDKAE